MWETQTEFPAAGISVVQPGLLWHLGNEPADEQPLSICLFLCVSLCFPNKMEKKIKER